MPLVSICCITYNQGNYIRDAIEGFLMQRTTFPIEIIIHDDASTDNTVKVVNEFAEKHPDLIVPIYQTINQYSQGIKPWPNFVFPRARGKYIALCEGDDYWTDPLKLQKQVDFMEQNRAYSICFTYSHKVNNDGKLLESIESLQKLEYQQYDFLIGRKKQTRTCTIVFRTSCLPAIYESKKQIRNGDTWLKIIATASGKGITLPFYSASYRISEAGIWSNSTRLARNRTRYNDWLIKLSYAYKNNKRAVPVIILKLSKSWLLKTFLNYSHKITAK